MDQLPNHFNFYFSYSVLTWLPQDRFLRKQKPQKVITLSSKHRTKKSLKNAALGEITATKRCFPKWKFLWWQKHLILMKMITSQNGYQKNSNWVQLDSCLVFSARVLMFFNHENSCPLVLQRKTFSALVDPSPICICAHSKCSSVL